MVKGKEKGKQNSHRQQQYTVQKYQGTNFSYQKYRR
jgi:hypothetical protein